MKIAFIEKGRDDRYVAVNVFINGQLSGGLRFTPEEWEKFNSDHVNVSLGNVEINGLELRIEETA